MDPKKRVKDLIRLALDQQTSDNERASSALRAVEMIDRYGLLDQEAPVAGKGAADTVARVVTRVTDPDFVDQVVTRTEKFVSGFDRVVDSVGRIARSRSEGRKRVRRYR